MHGIHSGARPLTLAALQAREQVIEADRTVSRKELSQAARDAAQALNLRPALRQVLFELVGVYNDQEIAGRLLVWPSNEYLMTRTGLSERTVRYSLARLVEMLLIGTKDSANGKRFAVRSRSGSIIDAFGFDLSPIYTGWLRFQELLQTQKDAAAARKRVFEEITICRRATQEALAAIAAEYAEIDTEDLRTQFDALARQTPRRGSTGDPGPALALWKTLTKEAERRYYKAGYAGNSRRQIESHNESIRNTCSKVSEDCDERIGDIRAPENVSVELVVTACPAIAGYLGEVPRTQAELVRAGEFLRPVIGASPSAWVEACDLLGPVGSAEVICLVLQRHDDDVSSGANRMRNPGGYFRAMARTVAEHRVDLESEFLGMIRRRARSSSP